MRGRFAGSAVALLLLLTPGCRAAEAPAEPAGAAAPVEAACDIAVWMVDDALGVEAEPAGEPMSDLLEDGEHEGCRLAAVGSFADLPEDVETPVDLLWGSFDEDGWYEDPRYATDTEDLAAIGMWKSGVLCVMGAVWDASIQYVDELRYDVMVECVPAEAPPIPPTGLMA